ncbi:hypothetical protein [Paenibacillus thalictri]|uniref:Uncharacterized protein n=1 Tax=Paenibacillus thalictri TaxID=2527873 RepID=A0A4Q9DKM2_9BACL|nr:hypothetical protein [Paenibacillus thalictri]TBL71391.1 hypothetical protein EYB31_30340 [Paenibacillus thalictri]
MKTIKRIPLLFPIFAVSQLAKYTVALFIFSFYWIPKGTYLLTRYALGFWSCDGCGKTYWANREYTVSGYWDHKHCHHCCDTRITEID